MLDSMPVRLVDWLESYMINSYARGVPFVPPDLVNIVPAVENEFVPESPVASAVPSYHIAEFVPFAKAVKS